MGQVTRTVNDLIRLAFFKIGEFDETDTISGTDFELAFDVLNLIIDSYSGDSSRITYTELLKFDLKPAQQTYSFSNVPGVVADIPSNRIAELEYCNVSLEDVLWPVTIITRTQLFNNYYNKNVTFRPAYVLVRKEVEQTLLEFYATPNQIYNCEVRAKFYLNKFEKFQPIRNVPLSLQRFFVFALARELLSYYPSGNWDSLAEQDYQTLRQDLVDQNDWDFSIRTSGLLRRRGRNYNGSLINILGG